MDCVGLKPSDLYNIHISTQTTSALYTAHTILRPSANGRGNVKEKIADKQFLITTRGVEFSTPMAVVVARVKQIISCFNLEYNKPCPNDTSHWLGVAAPLLSFMAGFKYRFDELRVGQSNFAIGKNGDVAQIVELSKWGLNTNHHSLCE